MDPASQTIERTVSISASHLTHLYGRQTAIRDVSFTVNKGEIVGFLGPNGAGKSTTLRILTGNLPATSGYAEVCGIPVATHPVEVRRKIGYMPENNPLPEDLRVIEYLRFRARIKGIPPRQRKAAIERALEICQLHRKARRKIIGSLSKGFRQRVGIADAILASPEVTILDEPTIGLDPHQVIAIRKLLQNLKGETTVIFSSHILSEVELSCDRVLILNQGILVAAGTTDELRHEFLPGSVFEIEAEADPTSLSELIAEQNPDFSISILDESNGVCRLSIAHPDSSFQLQPLLRKLLCDQPVPILSFCRIQPALEDVFLAATRRSWEVTEQEQPSMEESVE